MPKHFSLVDGYLKLQLKPCQLVFLPSSPSSFFSPVFCLNLFLSYAYKFNLSVNSCLCYCLLLFMPFWYLEKGFILLLAYDANVNHMVVSVDHDRHCSPPTHHWSDRLRVLLYVVFAIPRYLGYSHFMYNCSFLPCVSCLSECVVFLGFLCFERLHGSKITTTYFFQLLLHCFYRILLERPGSDSRMSRWVIKWSLAKMIFPSQKQRVFQLLL